jgi:hypothetical protein
VQNGRTYIVNSLNLAKTGGNWLTNKRHRAEQTGLANQDVEKLLVDIRKLCVNQEDGVHFHITWMRVNCLRLLDEGCAGRGNILEACNDLWEWSLANYNPVANQSLYCTTSMIQNLQRPVDDGNALGWRL